jgi:hypothetical protein
MSDFKPRPARFCHTLRLAARSPRLVPWTRFVEARPRLPRPNHATRTKLGRANDIAPSGTYRVAVISSRVALEGGYFSVASNRLRRPITSLTTQSKAAVTWIAHPKPPAPIPLGILRRLILGHAGAREMRLSGSDSVLERFNQLRRKTTARSLYRAGGSHHAS